MVYVDLIIDSIIDSTIDVKKKFPYSHPSMGTDILQISVNQIINKSNRYIFHL